jgi:hypothetical protein
MSAKSLSTKILELKRAYEGSMKGIPGRLRREVPAFDSYSPEAQARERLALQAIVGGETGGKVESVVSEIASERKAVPVSIGRVKFPFTSSRETDRRLIGEMQIASARSFVASVPDARALASEIRQALALGRIDYAWTILDVARGKIQKPILSDEDRELQAELENILEGIEGVPKIAELEKEAEGFQVVARSASEFQAQLLQGRETIVLPDLFPMLSPEERESELRYIQGSAMPLIDGIGMKRRVFDVLKRA